MKTRTIPSSKSLAVAILLVAFLSPRDALHAQSPLPSFPDSPQSLEGGLWRLDSSYQSTVVITNVLITKPLTATPVLYMEDGTRYTLPARVIAPASAISIDVEQALEAAPPAIKPHVSSFGMAGVEYGGPWAGAVLASVTNVDEIRRISFFTHMRTNSEQVRKNTVDLPRRVRGIWWKQTNGAIGTIYISNTAPHAIPATLNVFNGAGAQTSSQSLNIAPHSTLSIPLSELNGGIAKSGQGGFDVEYIGARHALSVNAAAEDDVQGFSAELPVFEVDARPKPTEKEMLSYAIPGLMVGQQEPAMLFPSGTAFSPHVVLRNLATTARSVSLLASFRQGGATVAAPLPPVLLASGQVENLDISALLALSGLSPSGLLNVQVSYAGDQADLLIAPFSTDRSNDFVFQVDPSI